MSTEVTPEVVATPANEPTMPPHGHNPVEAAPAVSTSTPVEPVPAVPASPVKVYMGGRVFDSHEEALAYADQQLKVATTQTPAPRPPANVQDVDPADLWYEDPKAAARLIKEQAVNEMRKETSVREQEKKIWNDFYEKNKDLKGMDDFVESVKNRNWFQIKDIPLDQALERIAKDSRTMIAKARGIPENRTQLQGGGVTTPSPTFGGQPKPQVTTKPSTMAEELKELSRKRKKPVQ